MLRVARVTDRSGRYYLADLAAELDLSPSAGPGWQGAARGRWIGTGAAGLGLRGCVDAEAFEAVLSGRHPSAGHPLRRRASSVSAYDLTFAAPKSASVLFATGGPGAAAAVRGAHEDAVDAAMAYAAARAATVRGSAAGGRGAVSVEGLVAASFTHGVSRALDPHLHSHVVVANLARGDDGRWRAVDGRGFYAHARAAGALYDAALRHGVTSRLGLSWTPRHGRGWEISSVDPVLLGAFSARRAEIMEHLDARPSRPGATRASPSRRARAVAWAATREPKSPSRSAAEVRARWAAVARDVGAPAGLVVVAPPLGAERADLDEHRFAASVAGDGQRGVARRDAIAAWAGALSAGARAEEVVHCVDLVCDWGTGTGVTEELRAPSAVVPPPHVLGALGARPASTERLQVWYSAAASIARYRERWGVEDRSRALGAGTRAALAGMPAGRLAEHLAAARAIDEALVTLGRGRDRARRLEAVRSRDRDGP